MDIPNIMPKRARFDWFAEVKSTHKITRCVGRAKKPEPKVVLSKEEIDSHRKLSAEFGLKSSFARC